MALPTLLRRLPDVPPALQAMLDSRRGPLAPPIRAEVFGLQRFAQHGRSLGETHRAHLARSGEKVFFPRMHGNILVLREAHRYIGLQAATGYDISPAAEWLLDNFHLIEAQIKAVREGLPRTYFKSLPVLLDEPLAGLPRVYGVAWAFVAHTDGAFDEDLLVAFLLAYQQTRALQLSELWALPTTLRVVLIENLRRLAERVAANKAARELANLCCDHIEQCTPHALDGLLQPLKARGVDRVFLAQMAQRLRDSGDAGTRPSAEGVQTWVNKLLPDLAEAQSQQAVDQAADNLSVSNAVTSLRAIGDVDWLEIVARASAVMALMLSSPLFAAEQSSTRDHTLHGIELLARRSEHSELHVAQTLFNLMDAARLGGCTDAMPSHWLQGEGRPALLRALGLHESAATRWAGLLNRQALPLYLGAAALATLAVLLGLNGHPSHEASRWAWLSLVALMAFPASEAVLAVINRLVSESTQPGHLPRLALVDGIPPAHRVLVVIPGMLSDTAACRALVHRLHLHYLANPEEEAQFALLTDWADADTASLPTDEGLLDGVVAQLQLLNEAHPRPANHTALLGQGVPGPRFIVLHRARRFSESEQAWIGWERKRGKLEELVSVMAREGAAGAFIDLGEASRLSPHMPYLVTLDADTQLPPNRLRELVGVAAHPSNQPRLDAQGLTVVSGYGILQPRIVTALPAPHERTLYHWLFAGRCGLDPYSAASSEVYQDLFAEGSFSGKGLLNVQAMHAVLSGRLPEGLVLSHDLLEGALARCAAVSDITVIEGAPFHADVASARLQRWTRGDWQLLPFLLHPAAHGLRAIHLWKMADNLRRSLLAPAMLALLLLTLAGTGLSPWMALGLVLAALSGGQVLGALAGLSSRRESLAPRPFYRHAFTELSRALWAGLWQLAMLLQQTLRSLGAIGLALYRVFISHRRLLQWASAASVQASSRAQFLPLLRQHGHESLVALGLLGLLLAAHTPAPGLATALCLLWAGSPWWTWLASRPRQANARQTLSAAEQAQLHGIARDTWRYFERCVTAQEHDLPPDNLQTDPHDMVAHRTSPTNIGLYLLSTACAREFGWIGTMELLTRLEATLATLDGLQRHRGHFLNWYDTSTGLALMPLYVSTVDSGNFSGHLLAVAEACLELATAPLDPSASQAAIVASKLRLAPRLSMRAALSPAMRDELKWRLDDHRATLRSAEQDQLARTRPGGASEASLRLRAVARRCEQLAWAADFTFLYHPKRHLLHIGYRVATDELDASFYDLLASESRLTSLLAMARGDLPVRHWAALSRPFCAVGSSAGLLSWSGSMFEYLMPTLVIDEPWGSALQVASLSAVQEQITFAESLGLPWGISESAYAGRDDTLAYQYAPQGVPRLALRRTPPDELVVAPYATALAVQQLPHQACLNFDRLEALQARGRYGFIEALDFSPARQAGPGLGTPVHTFMAHHQGMSIVALANVLLGGPAQRWGMAPARLQAVSALLHEWSPHEVSVMQEGPSAEPLQRLRQRPTGLLRELLPGVPAIEPTQLLSNGRYHVSLRGNGAGWSHWGAIGLSRSRDDALRDACGSFFYLRTAEMDHPVSLTQHPAPDPKAGYVATFHADRVCFEASWPGWLAQITVWVSPEDDIEFRQVTLQNLGDEALDIELLSAFEPTLADPRADESHPAFSQLFLRTSWLAAQQALVLARTPRIGPDRGLYAAHFLTESDPQVMAVRGQTDRALWQGRHHDPSRIRARLHALPTEAQLAEQSHAHPPGQPPEPGGDIPLATALDTGLDPVCAMGVQLHILPHGKVQLTFATAACDQLATLHAVVDKYRQHGHVQRASLMSATLSGIRLRTLRISPENMAAIQSLNTALLLTLSHPGPQSLHKLASVDTESRSTSAPPGEACDRRLLWRFGLSGERPMIFVTVSVMQGLGLLRALTQALRLWSWSGLACDLVVVNDEPASYQMALQREIAALRAGHLSDCGRAPGDATMASSVPCGFHALKADEVSPAELGTLRSLARVRLHADGRPLARQVQTWLDAHELALDERQETDAPAVPLDGTPLGEVSPSQGHFEDGGRGFTFALSAGRRPPRPWLNVLANPGFGTHVSDAGAGCTWALNSRLNQLTAWSNDPVGDPPSELFLMQDVRSGEAWSLTPNAWGDDEAVYEVSHGQGRSRIRHVRGDVAVSVSWCVDTETAVKQVRVQVRNRGQRHQTLRLFGLVEWLMGAQRGDRSTVHSSMLSQHLPGGHLNALLSTQRERAGGFGEGTAFFGLSSPGTADSDWTCDRRELFDARGRLVLPEQLGRRSGSGLDPCAALSTELVLAPGERAERTFLLGYAADPDTARQLATQAASVTPGSRLARVERHWDQLLQATTVSTPDPLFDALVNRWLLYQTVACRMWAKAGFYQAGGATGFRDQLQDAMALSWAAPEMLREQILLAASRQFPEGDVQHWWHSPGGAGVRTHFSDDLLWLPYACVHHLRRTGDTELLAQRVAFIDGPPVPPGAEDSYDTPTLSPQSATVYEHAARAIDRSLRVGQHGLPLMGTGDWNDGMNRVGQAGLGESVWLAWLLCQLVADFIPLAQARGEDARVAAWGEAACGWEAALNAPEGPVWDGHWYTRAFFDNGEPLGSHLNAEGRIDLIAQAWSLLSGMGKPAMQDEAMASADAYLVDHEAGLLRLLTPPFAHADPSPGYIQAYPPGVRENGGQYAHAGVWAMMAVARQAQEPRHAGDAAMAHFGDRVWRYFGCLSPAHRAAHPTRGPAYGLEPYVMAADVYSQPPWVGRGGWSWYTGSAAWMHRAAIESLFGLIVQGSVSGAQTLSFTPCLPSHWARAELTLRRDSRTMRFILVRAVEAEVQQMLNEGTAGTPEGARLLRVGELLDWSALGDASCFMLPLLQGH